MLQYLSVDIRYSNTMQTFFAILIKLPINVLHNLAHSRSNQALLIHITASPRRTDKFCVDHLGDLVQCEFIGIGDKYVASAIAPPWYPPSLPFSAWT